MSNTIKNTIIGQAITDVPYSVSVAAPNCMQAGILSTMAMLQGRDAEAFLNAQELADNRALKQKYLVIKGDNNAKRKTFYIQAR